jgi:hypothetical protein
MFNPTLAFLSSSANAREGRVRKERTKEVPPTKKAKSFTVIFCLISAIFFHLLFIFCPATAKERIARQIYFYLFCFYFKIFKKFL